MSGKIDTYTSTGIKLLNHPEMLKRLIGFKQPSPISLQVAPTSRCNLNCVFCSNANREKHEDIDLIRMLQLIYELHSLGLRTVEWTGGGEPLMYKHLETAIAYTSKLGLKQGLITNGILLKDALPSILEKLTWIRISMNCLDYVNKIEIPEIKGTLGFSYVWNDKTTDFIINRLARYVDEYHPAYVRIVPNCQASTEEQEINNARLSAVVGSWGHPYFYQAKHFSKPERCYWGWFKPFLLHNGWVYPCSSVVLNDDSDKSFHSKYQWIRMEKFAEAYKAGEIAGGDWNCTHCVFRPQNDLIESLVNPSGMEDFI